jgi:hypothetical protein
MQSPETMHSSAADEAQRLMALTEELSSLSSSFDATPSEAGLQSRYNIMAKLKEMQQAVRPPSDMAYQHSAQVRLLWRVAPSGNGLMLTL